MGTDPLVKQLWLCEITEEYLYQDSSLPEAEFYRRTREFQVISDFQVLENAASGALTVWAIDQKVEKFLFRNRFDDEHGNPTFVLDDGSEAVIRGLTSSDTLLLTEQDLELSPQDLEGLVHFAIGECADSAQDPIGFLRARLDIFAACCAETGRCVSLHVGIFDYSQGQPSPLWMRTRGRSNWVSDEISDRWLDLVEEAGFGQDRSDEASWEAREEIEGPLPRVLSLSLPELDMLSICPSVSRAFLAIYDSEIRVQAKDVAFFRTPADVALHWNDVTQAITLALTWAEEWAPLAFHRSKAKDFRSSELKVAAVEILNIAGEGAAHIPHRMIARDDLSQIGEYGGFDDFEQESKWRSLADVLADKIRILDSTKPFKATFFEAPEDDDSLPRKLHFRVTSRNAGDGQNNSITWSVGNGVVDDGDDGEGKPVSSDEVEEWDAAWRAFDEEWDFDALYRRLRPWFGVRDQELRTTLFPYSANTPAILARILCHIVRKSAVVSPAYVRAESL